jgi:hypothetical protein
MPKHGAMKMLLPFEKGSRCTKRMLAPVLNLQRKLKECSRRFPMREKYGETSW